MVATPLVKWRNSGIITCKIRVPDLPDHNYVTLPSSKVYVKRRTAEYKAPFTWIEDDPSASVRIIRSRYLFSSQFTWKVLHLALALGSSYLRGGMILAPYKRSARDNSPTRDNSILTLRINYVSFFAENCALRGTDNVRRKISGHIFKVNTPYWIV